MTQSRLEGVYSWEVRTSGPVLPYEAQLAAPGLPSFRRAWVTLHLLVRFPQLVISQARKYQPTCVALTFWYHIFSHRYRNNSQT